MSTTITTANHILVEKNSNRSDISLCLRAPWSMSLCSLLPTVPSTTNPHLLYVARHVNSVTTLISTIIIKAFYVLWRKFLPKWYILMSATSLVFSSRFSLLSTVSSTTNSYVLNVVRHVEIMKNSHVNHHHHSTSHPCKRKFQLKWYILMSVNSLVFSSLLFLLFTVPPIIKTIWAKIRQVGYPIKRFSRSIKVLQDSCLWVR